MKDPVTKSREMQSSENRTDTLSRLRLNKQTYRSMSDLVLLMRKISGRVQDGEKITNLNHIESLAI